MIKKLIDWLDRIPEIALLIVNICIAGFVGLSHGGALALAVVTKAEDLAQIQSLARVSLPLAGLVFVTSIVALVWRQSRTPIMATQAVILCVGAGSLLVWSTSILISGLPKGNFAWSPGLMALFCTYPVYLLRRTLLRKRLMTPAVRYLHLLVFLLALVVDAGVFGRALSSFRQEIMRRTTGQSNQALEAIGGPRRPQPHR